MKEQCVRVRVRKAREKSKVKIGGMKEGKNNKQ
jgi:hypothetical protein